MADEIRYTGHKRPALRPGSAGWLAHRAGMPSRKQDNTRKGCRTPGCSRMRAYGFGGQCSVCQRRLQLHGHPEGRPIPGHLFKEDKRLVLDFLVRYRNTPQVMEACRWVKALLQKAASGTLGLPGERELKMLADLGGIAKRGIEPVEFIATAVAIIRYSLRCPHVLPADGRLAFALTTVLLKLGPRERTPKGNVRPVSRKAKETIGSLVRRALGTFAQNVSDALEREHNSRCKSRDVLAEPFKPLGPTFGPGEVPPGYHTIRMRVYRGWSRERAHSTPVPVDGRTRKKKKKENSP